ncbi:cytochrome P450, partial [Streptomyces jumonjinensis]
VDPMWVATRHEDIRTVMSDARFTIDATAVPGAPVAHRTEQTWQARGMRPGYEKYLHAGIFDADGADHHRLRGLVTAAFSRRRAATLRPRIETIATGLLDRLPDHAEDGMVDLIEHFARPLPRYATCDTTLGSTPVRAGEAGLPIVSAANRDPAAFTDPDRLDITRTRHSREHHLGFGHGAHRCPGAHLAHEETRIALTALLDRAPGLRFATAPERLRRGTNPVNWHLKALPVRL